MAEHTHFFSASKNEHLPISEQKPYYLRNVAKKMRADLDAGTAHPTHSHGLADHIDATAEQMEQKFEADYLAEHGTPYVKRADRPK